MMSTKPLFMTRTPLLISSICLSFSLFSQYVFTNSLGGIPTNFTAYDIMATSPTEIYVAGMLYQNQQKDVALYKSIDGGVTWSSVFVNGINSIQVYFLAICKAGDKMLVATGSESGLSCGIYVSTTNGSTWVDSNNGIPDNFWTCDFYAESVDVIYVVGGLYQTGVGYIPQIYKTTDAGANWTLVTTNGAIPSQNFFTTMCKTNGGYLLAGEDQYSAANCSIFSSNDAQNWTNVYDPPNFTVYEFIYRSPTEMYVLGTFHGTYNLPRIYRSLDGGNTWGFIPSSGISNTQTSIYSACLAGEKLIITTVSTSIMDNGIYATDIGSAGLVESSTMFSDVHAYPNPVNDEFVVEQIADGYDKYTLLDATGNLVQEGDIDPLKSEILVDKLNPGIYVLRLAGKTNKEIKLIKN